MCRNGSRKGKRFIESFDGSVVVFMNEVLMKAAPSKHDGNQDPSQ